MGSYCPRCGAHFSSNYIYTCPECECPLRDDDERDEREDYSEEDETGDESQAVDEIIHGEVQTYEPPQDLDD